MENKQNGLSVLDEQYFADKARLGLENFSPDDLPTPYLKFVNVGSSVTDVDGQPIKLGSFYYPPTDEELAQVPCSIFTYTKEMKPSFSNDKVMEKVYNVYGVFESEDQSFKPFKIILNGVSIGVFKQFLATVTAQKLPMFALKLELSSTKEISKTTGKPYYKLVIKSFGVRKNSNQILELENLASMTVNKANEEVIPEGEDITEPRQTEVTNVLRAHAVSAEPVRDANPAASTQGDVDPEDIPF